MKTSLQTNLVPSGLLQDAREKRDSRRRRLMSLGLIVLGENHPGLDCIIHDVCDNGARICFARTVALPQRFWLLDVRGRTAHTASLAWRNDLEAGLSFDASMSLGQIGDPALLFLRKLWLKHVTR